MLRAVERFGAQAIFGRILYAGEVRAMTLADNILHWHSQRKQAASYAAWEMQHIDEARILATAMLDYIERYPDG